MKLRITNIIFSAIRIINVFIISYANSLANGEADIQITIFNISFNLIVMSAILMLFVMEFMLYKSYKTSDTLTKTLFEKKSYKIIYSIISIVLILFTIISIVSYLIVFRAKGIIF